METQNIWLLAVIGLLVGGLLTYELIPRTVIEEKVQYVDRIIEKVVNVSIPVEKIVNVPIPSADALLNLAQRDAWSELKDDDDFLTCDSTEYNDDEVEIGRITDWAYHWIDSDESELTYIAKYKFDSTDDNDRCTSTRTIKVFWEEGEDPEVSWD